MNKTYLRIFGQLKVFSKNKTEHQDFGFWVDSVYGKFGNIENTSGDI